jgi:hypothetical protein
MSVYLPLASTQFGFASDARTRDIDAHFGARTVLVTLLTRCDARSKQLLTTFGGLWEDARQLAAFCDDFARDCGWANRRAMFTAPEAHDAERSPRYQEFDDRHRTFPWNRLADFPAAADELVFTTWGLPRDHPRERWSWLTADLMRCLVIALVDEIFDENNVIGFSCRPQQRPIDLHFISRAGEPVAETRRRLKALFADAETALSEGVPRQGGTLLSPEKISRDVRVFYLRQMADPPVTWHALEKQIGLRGDQRANVKQCYKRGRRLLSEVLA